MLSVGVLFIIMLNAIILNVATLNVVVLNVVMLSVIMLSVVVPSRLPHHGICYRYHKFRSSGGAQGAYSQTKIPVLAIIFGWCSLSQEGSRHLKLTLSS
jgi:hypothetical protein